MMLKLKKIKLEIYLMLYLVENTTFTYFVLIVVGNRLRLCCNRALEFVNDLEGLFFLFI